MDGQPAPLVDRLAIALSDAQTQALNAWIDQQQSGMDIARARLYDRQQKYLYTWDDFVTFQRKGPWESSSNLHMPLTHIMVKIFHARLYNIFANAKTTQLRGREGTDTEQATMVRKLRDWYLWDYLNEYRGLRGFAREVFYDTVTVGFGIGMKDWHVRQRKSIVLEPNELRRELADMAPQIAEGQATRPALETTEEMATRGLKTAPYREVQKLLTVFEGSRVRALPFENVFFPNTIHESSNLDAPACVIVETELSVSELRLAANRGEWDPVAVQRVIAEEGTPSRIGGRGDNVQRQREQLAGYDSTAIQYDKSPRALQYCFCRYDLDDDGIDEEFIAVRSKSRKILLKAVFLDLISPSGLRPLVKFDCFAKPRQAYARGLPEFMWPLNEEMDQTHNMRLDYLALQTCPFGTYRASSSLKNEPIRIAPGKFIPTDETTDMKVLNFQTNAISLRGEEALLWQYAERQAGVSALQQGMVPETVGPTRSTSGVVTLLRQMEKEFQPMVDQCAEQWKKLEKLLLDDLDRRIHPAFKMRVLGAAIEQYVDQQQETQVNAINEALRVNAMFDVVIDVAQVIRSEEVVRSEATQVLQTLTAPSLAAQLGVIGPKALMKAYREWLEAFDKDPDDYLDRPAFIDQPLTLYQETQVCQQGQIPPMAMQDDHPGKAQMLRQWLTEPSYQEGLSLGIIAPGTDQWIEKAARKHEVLAAMLAPQGLPNPSGANAADTQAQVGGPATHDERIAPPP
ncbi:MAG: hypothetical protein WC935_05710, partial [Thermoleophilia bacterium]